MKLIDVMATFHNWLIDKDMLWWPFSVLRPEKNQLMTFKTTFMMTACFGGFAFAAFIILAVMNNAMSFSYFISVFATCFIGFFAWFNLITKPLWNHRARTLSAQK